MTDTIEYLREVNTFSIIVRLTLAVVFSGIIGLERGRKKKTSRAKNTYFSMCWSNYCYDNKSIYN